MVSKNNKYQKQLMTLDREVPHYSLRKLGIGVVSVLLGTTMYLGTNNAVANADEVVNSSNANSDGVAKETNATNNVMSASAVTLSQSPSTNTVPQNNQASAVSSQTSAANNGTSQAASTPVSAADSTATQSFTVPQGNVANNAGQTFADNKAEQNNSVSVTLNDGSILSTDDNNLCRPEGNTAAASLSKTSTLDFKINKAKVNDTYTIRIPAEYVNGVESTGITANYGNSQVTQEGDYYYVIDKFNKPCTITNFIALTGAPTLDVLSLYKDKPDSLYPGEKLSLNISVKKNNEAWKELSYIYQLPTKVEGSLLIGPTRTVYTKASEDSGLQIISNIPVHNGQTIQYQLKLKKYGLLSTTDPVNGTNSIKNYLFNHGGTLTFTAPKYFTVDTSHQLIDASGQPSDATISQSGNIVTVHIPAGSKALVDNTLYFYGTVNAPKDFLAGDNTSLTFTNGKYVQNFNNNTSQQFNSDSESIIVRPEVPNTSDGWIYDIFQNPSYNYVGGSQDDDDVQGIVDHKSAQDTAMFYVTNAINTSRKNVKIHVDYPQGINFQPFGTVSLVGNRNNHFTVTYTYTDGSTEYGANKNVKSIDVTIDELDPGAMVKIGPSYYSVANTLKPGDSLKTFITVGNGSKKVQDDMIIAKPTLPLGLHSHFSVYQSKKSPLWRDNAGDMTISFTSTEAEEGEKGSRLELVRPIIYVKLPNNATLGAFDKSSFGKYKPKSISFFNLNFKNKLATGLK